MARRALLAAFVSCAAAGSSPRWSCPARIHLGDFNVDGWAQGDLWKRPPNTYDRATLYEGIAGEKERDRWQRRGRRRAGAARSRAE